MNVHDPRIEPKASVKPSSGVSVETVASVKHYTDRLFSFRMTRPASFRFRSGEFAMIGLPSEGGKEATPFRAYSMASPSWDDELEFYSIKVPGGPLTERLKEIQPGDSILIRGKPTGTLVNDALTPGERLYFLATGTGIAPFASLARDPETYEKFGEVILAHTCRTLAELQYGFDLEAKVGDDPLVGEHSGRFRYFPSATREDWKRSDRIGKMIETGSLFRELNLPAFDPASDRVMICGSMAMLKELKALCESRGFREGSNASPGDFVIERAFVG